VKVASMAATVRVNSRASSTCVIAGLLEAWGWVSG
jgi:hypothetical protein